MKFPKTNEFAFNVNSIQKLQFKLDLAEPIDVIILSNVYYLFGGDDNNEHEYQKSVERILLWCL